MKKAFCNGRYLSHLWNVKYPNQLEIKSQFCKKWLRKSHMKYFNKNKLWFCLKAHSLTLWDGVGLELDGSTPGWPRALCAPDLAVSAGVTGVSITNSLFLKPKSSAELFEDV